MNDLIILFPQRRAYVTRRLIFESESTLTFKTINMLIAVEEMQESGVCLTSSNFEEKSRKMEKEVRIEYVKL